MQKALRKGKVLIDWSQNDEHKTTVNVYSLRAKSQPMVSTPVTWAEVDSVAKKGDASRLAFDSETALKRVEKHGDLFSPLLTLKQRLPSLQVDCYLSRRSRSDCFCASCSIVHWSGALSGLQRRSFVPCRKRPPVTWS